MAYGIKVTGSDTGGEYLVTDSDQNLINYGITQSGRASSFTLNRSLASDTFIFVRNPDNFATDPVVGGFAPDYHYLSVTGGTTVRFYGGKIVPDQFGDFDTIDGLVAMDYAVLEKANTNITASGNYGIQILTSTGALAFDSRRLATNNSITIDSVLAASYSSSNAFGSPPEISKTSSQYVNLEWTGRGGGDLFGISDLDDTTVYVLEGELNEAQDGTESLRLYADPYFTLLIATLN